MSTRFVEPASLYRVSWMLPGGHRTLIVWHVTKGASQVHASPGVNGSPFGQPRRRTPLSSRGPMPTPSYATRSGEISRAATRSSPSSKTTSATANSFSSIRTTRTRDPPHLTKTTSGTSVASASGSTSGHGRTSGSGPRRRFRERATASRPVLLALDEISRTFPAPAVYALVPPYNEASMGLLESLGFSEEGRSRWAAYWNGEYTDAIKYSLLREE